MNRLYHLRKTLPQNIKDNISYGNVEFIVLDYNSKDDLETWITTEMSYYLKKGILKYLKTIEPKTFHMSHSKNVVAKYASGSILCNVDADNYIGEGFAEYINEEFDNNQNIYITVNNKKLYSDCGGRIIMYRKDFWTLKGYDESMKGYGFEDHDLCNRLELLGRKPVYIDSMKFLNVLHHSDEARLKNESNNVDIKYIFIRYINHAVSEIVYLFKNKKYYRGKIIDNKSFMSSSVHNTLNKQNFEYTNNLYKDKWIIGNWKQTGDNIIFKESKKNNFQLTIGDTEEFKTRMNLKKNVFYPITEKDEIETTIMFFSQINNRIKMKKNERLGVIVPNLKHFGETKIVCKS